MARPPLLISVFDRRSSQAGMRRARIVATVVIAAVAQPVATQNSLAPEPYFGARPMYGGAIGQPLLVSGSVGLIVGRVYPEVTGQPPTSKGLFLQAEPGLGGGKVSIGVAKSDNSFGLAAKACLVRTWGRTWGATPNATYAGGDVQLTGYAIRLSAGCLWRTGASPTNDSMFTWGVGLGF